MSPGIYTVAASHPAFEPDTAYAVAILENFGFRQLTAIWRFQGLVRWLRGGEHKWETITRSANLADVA